MNWSKPHLESLNILQLRELKHFVDQVLEKKIAQSQRIRAIWDEEELLKKEEYDRNNSRKRQRPRDDE
tara:strand:+ start:1096 stop:1299 length:204 start_codon:yes stop_codon:yes gene_type:complete